MKIENIDTKDITPYAKNAKKHTKKQIKQIERSIGEFGFNDPIAIDEKGVVIEGHGRLMAAKNLGYEQVPCIRIAGLSNQQKKAYILVHNKLTMNTGFDADMLADELRSISEFDMTEFDFEIPDFDPGDDDSYYGDERKRTYNTYNLEEYDGSRAAGKYQMPMILAQNAEPEELMSFNYVLSSKKRDCGVHFYIDDYQFERMWNSPKQYIDKLKEFECVLTPDFSLYLDMPMAMKIWNVYRSHLIGQMMQDAGITVVPTLTWAEPATYDFAFDGIEQGGTVSVSTIGVKMDDENKTIWYNGMTEALRRIRPKGVLVYGGDIGYKFPCDVWVKQYDNKAFKRG